MGYMMVTRPGKRLSITNWKIHPFLMGKSTISMAIFNSYVSLPEGNWYEMYEDSRYFEHCWMFFSTFLCFTKETYPPVLIDLTAMKAMIHLVQ